jgi:hypothetical protein
VSITSLPRILLLMTLPLASLRAQQPNPFGGGRSDTGKARSLPSAMTDSLRAGRERAQVGGAPVEFEGVDSVIYRASPRTAGWR